MKTMGVLFLLMGLTACASLPERLAKRVGCDHTKLMVNNQIHVPAYSEYKFTCEGVNYVCRDVPFHSSCEEDKDLKKDKKKEAEETHAK